MRLEDLTPEQAAAVRAVAGDDPAAQAQAIETLRPTWALTDAQRLTELRRVNPFAHARILERRQQAAEAQARARFASGKHPSQRGTK